MPVSENRAVGAQETERTNLFSHMYPKSNFRLDINGLRAWAVIAVMLYHFEVPGFGGGFVGVDIFFVISGFLMTGIVSKGLGKNTFHFFDFLIARARRIIPALLVLCAALLILGWFALPPTDYKALASHAVYSLLFVSNIEYWLSAGYFDSASHEKWLLHTWSLSVEWQFYLVLPIVLWTAWKFRAQVKFQKWVVISFMIASLAAAIIISPRDSSASFYLLHTRAWELLCGGLLTYLNTETVPARWRKISSLTGLGMITASILFFTPETLWPYFWTLVPVAGTMLVIASNQRSFLTDHPIAQWLGDRSYSLYLWHWPVFVVLVTLEWRDRTGAIPIGLLVATLLAMLSYRFAEKPSRHFLAKQNAIGSFFHIASATSLVGLMGFIIWHAQGAPARLPTAAKVIMAEQQRWPARFDDCQGTSGVTSPNCEFGHSPLKILVIGDSHVFSVIPGAIASLPNITWAPLNYTGCPFIQGLKLNPHAPNNRSPSYKCEEHNKWVKEIISAAPQNYPVLLVGRYAIQALGLQEPGRQQGIPVGYISKPTLKATPDSINELAAALTNTACDLAQHRQVFMLRPTPDMPINVPTTAIRRIMFGTNSNIFISKNEYMKRNSWVWKAQDKAKDQCGVIILDPIPQMCENEICNALANGIPIYRDSNHLTQYGAQLLTHSFKSMNKTLQAQNVSIKLRK